MAVCRCGCGHEAKASGWARRGCSLRAIPRDVRSRRSRRWAQTHKAQMAAAGRTGGRKAGAKLRARSSVEAIVLRELNAQGECIDFPAAVIRRVYRLGYLQGWKAQRRPDLRRTA
jgi:hypothetical protein